MSRSFVLTIALLAVLLCTLGVVSKVVAPSSRGNRGRIDGNYPNPPAGLVKRNYFSSEEGSPVQDLDLANVWFYSPFIAVVVIVFTLAAFVKRARMKRKEVS